MSSATLDEVWALFREVAEAQKETDCQIKQMSKKTGDLGNRLGEFVEGLVKPALVRLFQARGIAVHEVHPDVSVDRHNEGIQIDLLVVNDTEAVLVEVKSKLAQADVDEHLERLAKFKRMLPRYSDVRALGAVAAMMVPPEVARYAYRQGLFVLAQAGDSVAILNDDRFQPKAWQGTKDRNSSSVLVTMKISIITAIRNSHATIADALDSALAQDHPDKELIVIDGASTDGTLDVIQRYAGRLAHLVSEPDHGIYDALNKGLRLAKGEVVGFLHADDRYADDRVLSRIATALADPGVDACYGDLRYVRQDDPGCVVRYWRAGDYRRQRLAWGWMPPHPTFYARRAVYQRLGGFDTRYRIAADYDCLLRFLGAGRISCTYIPEVLVHMRVGGANNRSLRNLLQKSREDYQILRHNQIGGLGALLLKNVQKLPQFFRRP